jgi:hypothetical protein
MKRSTSCKPIHKSKCSTIPSETFASQCNFGITQITTPWILSVDADYELSDDLVKELRLLAPAKETVGYRAQFVYRTDGRPLRGSLYPPRILLYRKDQAIYCNEGHGHRVSWPARSITTIAHRSRIGSPHSSVMLAKRRSILPIKRLARNDRIRLAAWPARAQLWSTHYSSRAACSMDELAGSTLYSACSPKP